MDADARYEELADRAEQASEELAVREGRVEADQRPLRDASLEDLQKWAYWDPEQDDPDLIEDLGGGIELRRVKSRSTGKRRLKAEPEGEMPEAEAPKPPSSPAPRAPRKPARSPSAPKRVHTRIPLGAGLSQLVGALGVGLIVTGRDPGVGIALQFEAPIAGDKLDAMIQGTPLDRVAQPLARAGKAGREAGSILALPFLVGLIERRPELYPVLREPLLRPLVVEMAIELEEAGRRAASRLREAQRRRSGNQIDSDELLAQLFEGRPPKTPDAPEDGGGG